MLAGEIAQYENQTHAVLMNQGKLAAGLEGNLQLFDVRPGHASHYYNANSDKRRIVLHFTTGFLGGDISTLTTPSYHVSVSFVVARNGRIYRLFPTEKWSFHTGLGTVGGNEAISRSSIGIEISNIGYLDRSGNWMWNYYGDRYCAVADTQYYQTLAEPYRGKVHYATYTQAQYAAVRNLLRVLTQKHGIPATFLPANRRYSVFQTPDAGRNFRGICSHVNYRPSGKWDIGPAFDWAAVGA